MADTCVNCASYVNGYCHRYPPTVIFMGSNLTALWPQVEVDDWCNEWQASTGGLSISSLSPDTLAAGSTPATVTVTGTGFDNTCYIRVNNATRATFYISATELQYTSRPDLAASGDIDNVVVEDGNGNQSNALSFTFT